MLLCATGMEHGHGHGRGGGESLIFDPGRVLMKRRHSACALQPETELEKKKKTAAFPPSGLKVASGLELERMRRLCAVWL